MYLQPNINNYHQGTFQSDRLPEALDPGYVRIDERSLEDLVKQSAEFSRFLTFYNSNNVEDGNWQDFFRCIYHFAEGDEKTGHVLFSTEEELDAIVADKPFLSLLVAFLKAFKLEQDNLNKLTGEHLDYYYRTMLRFARKAGSPGRVPLSVTLVKGRESAFIPKGTLFDAGKDADGKKILYRSDDDYSICDYKMDKPVALYAAGKDFSDHIDTSGISEGYGFGILVSSPKLAGYEKEFTIAFGRSVSKFDKVQISGQDGWVDMERKKLRVKKSSLARPRVLNSLKNEYPVMYKVDPKDVAPYNPAVHGGDYNFDGPVLRFSSRNPDKIANDISVYGQFRIIISGEEGNAGLEEIYNSYKTVIDTLNGSITKAYKELTDNLGKHGDDLNKTDLDTIARYKVEIDEALKQTVIMNPSDSGSSSKTITVNGADVRVFTPFGEAVTGPATAEAKLLDALEYPKEEEVQLVFGFSGMRSSSRMDLYCRVDETKSDPNVILPDSTNITWSFWNGSAWQEIYRSSIIKDTTAGLTKSGIVSLNIDNKAFFMKDGLLPAGKVWIRLSYKNSFAAYPGLVKFETNVIELEYDPSSEGAPVLGVPLAPGTISKPVITIPGVKKVVQENAGYPGSYPEEEDGFYSRVSERLRHKDRMCNIWDYERMVLEHNPDIAAVKCIPCTSEDSGHAPGNVTIMLIPDCLAIPQADILQPCVGSNKITEIKELVKAHTSPFAKVLVRNPEYNKIRVNCKIIFKKNCPDTNYCCSVIRERLVSYLAPWTDMNQGIKFTDNKNTSNIEYFIEMMEDMVDAVKEFKVFVDDVECEGDLVPGKQYAIFTSVAAEKHQITAVENI